MNVSFCIEKLTNIETKRKRNNNKTLNCLWIIEEGIFRYLWHEDQHSFHSVCRCLYNRIDMLYEWNIRIDVKCGKKMKTREDFISFLRIYFDGNKNHFISRLNIQTHEFCEWVDDQTIAEFFVNGRLRDLQLNNTGRENVLLFLDNNRGVYITDILTDETLRILGTRQQKHNRNSKKEGSFFNGIETLILPRCDKITNDGLKYLENCSSLKVLNLGNANEISDEGLVNLRDCHALEILDFYHNRNVTDQGLDHLKNCTSLKQLNLGSNQNVTYVGLRYLQGCPLQYLNLHNCCKNKLGLKSYLETLPQFSNKCSTLKELDIGGVSWITDSDLFYLKGIKKLHLHGFYITDIGLKTLEGIEELALFNARNVTNLGLSNLQSSIKYLTLGYAKQITYEDIQQFKKQNPMVSMTSNHQPISIVGN